MDALDQSIQKEAERLAAESGNNTNDSASSAEDNNGSQDASASAAPEAQNENAATPAADAAPAAAQNNTIVNTSGSTDTNNDFIANLERISGGTIKSQEDFLAALEKAKEVDTLKPTLAELQAKAAINPYANEYEQRRNELLKSGATKDQLKAFEKINDLGDLAELTSIEAKIAKMVLVDGVGERVARLKVEKAANFEDLEGVDLEIAQSDFDLSAKADRKAIEDYKVQVSTPPVSDTAIQAEAAKAKLESDLNPVLKDFTEKFVSLGTVNLNKAKEGELAVNLDLELSADDRAVMAKDIRDYLVLNNEPLTQESYNEALSFARAKYAEANIQNVAQKTWQKAEAHFTKLFTEKYENTGGKPRAETHPGTVDENKRLERAFKDELLGKSPRVN